MHVPYALLPVKGLPLLFCIVVMFHSSAVEADLVTTDLVTTVTSYEKEGKESFAINNDEK